MDFNKLCFGCMQEREEFCVGHKCKNCGYVFGSMPTSSYILPPGTVLYGKYLLGKMIGEGGFGITYLGIDMNLEIKVAIKEFFPNGCVTRDRLSSLDVITYTGKTKETVEKWKDSFLNEARRLGKFTSLSGIVSVRDFFQDYKTAYIVMDYIDGTTLKDYLKACGGKISVEQTLEMMKPIISSLQKVHEAGIVHRDISPDNIMIDDEGRTKLIDFGAARDFASEKEKSLSIMLKPGYAPEEQYRTHGEQGPWTDVYAICATIYRCITGVKPVESMERMRNDLLVRPSEMGINVSRDIEDTIMAGMAVYRDNRISSAKELESRLYNDQNIILKNHVPTNETNDTPPVTQNKSNIENKENENSKGNTEKKRFSLGDIWNNKRLLLLGIALAAIIGFVLLFVLVSYSKNNSTTTENLDANINPPVMEEEAIVEETTEIEEEDVEEPSEDEIDELDYSDYKLKQVVEDISEELLNDISYYSLSELRALQIIDFENDGLYEVIAYADLNNEDDNVGIFVYSQDIDPETHKHKVFTCKSNSLDVEDVEFYQDSYGKLMAKFKNAIMSEYLVWGSSKESIFAFSYLNEGVYGVPCSYIEDYVADEPQLQNLYEICLAKNLVVDGGGIAKSFKGKKFLKIAPDFKKMIFEIYLRKNGWYSVDLDNRVYTRVNIEDMNVSEFEEALHGIWEDAWRFRNR